MSPPREKAKPIEYTVQDMTAAQRIHRRNSLNALAVSVINSRNAPCSKAPNNVPNGRVRAETAGGWEVERVKALEAKLELLYARQANTYPGTRERIDLDAVIDRAEGYVRQAKADVEAIDTAPRIPPGQPDVFVVKLPALQIRVLDDGGETRLYRADEAVWKVWVDLNTPRLREYQHLPPEHLTGRSPLYVAQANKRGMQRAQRAEEWHVELMEALLGDWPMPALYAQQTSETEPTESGVASALTAEVVG